MTPTTWQPLDFAVSGSVAGRVTGIKPIHTVGNVRVELSKRTYVELQRSKANAANAPRRDPGASEVMLLRKLAVRAGVTTAPILRLKKDHHLIEPLLGPM